MDYLIVRYLCLMLYRYASTWPTCTASVTTSNRLRGFAFLKIQKSVGLSRTGLRLKIPVLQKLTVEAKDGRCGIEVLIKMLCCVGHLEMLYQVISPSSVHTMF